MSKTIEEIKEQVAFDYGHSDWRELEKEYERENISFEHVYKEVAERYAQSQTQELKEQNAELVEVLETIASLITSQTSISTVKTSLLQVLTKYNHLNKKP